MNLHLRAQRGNVLILVGAITLGVIIAVLLFALDYSQILGSGHQQLSAVESAGLAAAQDLSRIVIKDPNYGFIALADYPPVGKATVGADRIPCPVTGINTILGTARLDMLIAQQSGNADLKALARRDAENAKGAARNLMSALNKAMQPGGGSTGSGGSIVAVSNGSAPSGPYTDMDGNYINPYEDAKNIYQSNLVTMANGGTPMLQNFKLTLGFVNTGSTTRTPIPNPADSNASNNQVNGNYKAFVNIPSDDGTNWYFAGVSAQPALVDARNFQSWDTDPNQVSSIVRVDADYTFIRHDTNSSPVHSIACAEPSSGPDTPPPGVLSVMFPDGLVPGINSTYDLFNNTDLRSNNGFVTQATNGDWPFTPGSSIVPGSIPTSGGTSGTPTVEQMWAHAFYSWLRSGHTKPKVDQTVALVKQQSNLIFSMRPDGSPAPSFDIMQKAYAQSTSTPALQTALQQSTNASAREQALLTPGNAAAVTAYSNMADYTPVITQLAGNSWQVGVSSNGTVTSADGNTTLSNATIGGFWGQVNDTNTASLAAMGMGQSVAISNQTSLGTFVATEPSNLADVAVQTAVGSIVSDLNSLVNQIQSDTGPVQPSWVSQLVSDESTLASKLTASGVTSTATNYANAVKAGVNTVANGVIGAYETYMMIQHENWLTSQGISQNSSSYTVDGISFTSHPTQPLTTSAITTNSASSGSTPSSNWSDTPHVPGQGGGFTTFDLPNNIANDTDGAPPQSQQASIPWKFYFYQFDAAGNVVRTHQEDTPFYDMPVSDKQNMSISYGAMTTNATIPITWTAVSRVQSSNLGQGRHFGQPWPGDPVNWCEMPYFQSGSASPQQMGEGSAALGISVVNSGSNSLHYSSRPQTTGKNICWWDAVAMLFTPPAQACGGGHGGCGHGHGHGHGHGGGSNLHGSGNSQPGSIPLASASFQVAASGTVLSPQPRPNYYCGGLASDFQLCAPLAIPSVSNTKQNALGISQTSGSATYTDGSGTSYAIPGTSNMSVQSGSSNAQGPDGQPGTGNSQTPLPQPDPTVL